MEVKRYKLLASLLTYKTAGKNKMSQDKSMTQSQKSKSKNKLLFEGFWLLLAISHEFSLLSQTIIPSFTMLISQKRIRKKDAFLQSIRKPTDGEPVVVSFIEWLMWLFPICCVVFFSWCHFFFLDKFETLNESVPGEHVSRPYDSSVWYLLFGPLMSGRWISCYSFLKISAWRTSDRPKTLSIDDEGSCNDEIEAANNLILSTAWT
jgi:hypothetical protein